LGGKVTSVRRILNYDLNIENLCPSESKESERIIKFEEKYFYGKQLLDRFI